MLLYVLYNLTTCSIYHMQQECERDTVFVNIWFLNSMKMTIWDARCNHHSFKIFQFKRKNINKKLKLG